MRRSADLPAQAALYESTAALAARLDTWRLAAATEDEYVGPVVFEGQAAIEIFFLPPGWTVDDDPAVDPTLESSYAYDDEGVVAGPSTTEMQLVPDEARAEEPRPVPSPLR